MVKSVLDKLRHPGRAKSIVAYILFGAIIIVFVFFFQTGPLRNMNGGGSAAIVNGQVISLTDFRVRAQRQEEQLRGRLEGLPDSQRQLFSNTIRRRALEDLVMSEVLVQSGEGLGFHVPDQAVREKILEVPQFQEEGQFRRDRYENILEANHLKTWEFEEKMRKDIMSQRTQEVFTYAFSPIPQELEKETELQETQINIGFIEYDNENLTTHWKPSVDEIKSFLNSAEGKSTAEEYYSKHKTTAYVSPEQVRAQHVLIKFQSGDKKSEEQALEKIRKISERLVKEDFGKVAQEVSEDEGTRPKQGDLDYFARGQMVKEFEDVAFNLKKGEVSSPVKSPFGYHIIKLNDHRQAGEKKFDEVADSIAEKLLKEKQADKLSGKLKELLKSDLKGKELELFLRSLKLDWQETGEFSLANTGSVPRLGDNEPIVNAALSLKKPNDIYPEVISSSGKYYLVKLKSLGKKKTKENESITDIQKSKYLAYRKSGDAFENWLNSQKEKSNISINEQLFKTPSNEQ